MTAPDLAQDLDLSGEELLSLLDLAAEVKRTPLAFRKALRARSIALLFEKPSLRTRLTFELGVKQLGGEVIACDGPIGGREPLKDVARNLERWTNGIVARTFKQDTIEQLAHWSSVPVINALSDLYHPCQALADVLTLKEKFGGWQGLKLAFVGDGNNVAHSLMLTATRLGVEVAVAAPAGFEPNAAIIAQAEGLAAVAGTRVTITNDPHEALAGAHAVYTDVWASMGQEEEAAERREAFRRFQINEELFAAARPEAIFMHCLPAHRGEEVSDGVIENVRSVVFDQAENRLHAQKALLVMLIA
jgi:ornithine carbamoyltransferase